MQIFGPSFYLLSLYVIVPVLLARYLAAGTWQQIRQAYVIWIGILAVLGLLLANSQAEGWGWAFILGMFWTIPSLPLIVLLLKLRSWCRRATTSASR